jgi:PAS domain S-box-containing protein
MFPQALTGGQTRVHARAGEPHSAIETERQRLAELEETARRYRELKRALPAMMFVVDGTGRFLDVNERFTACLGYGPAEVLGKKLYEVVEDEAEDPRQRMMPFFARSGGRRTLLTRSGRKVQVIASSVGRYDEAGQFSGAVVVCREVGPGEERAEAIANAAQEMSQPLSGIYGYSELLKSKVGRHDPAYRYARKIYEQSERLAALVKRIKAEQGMPPNGLSSGGDPGRRVGEEVGS